MKSLRSIRPIQSLAFVCALGIATQALAAAAQTKALPGTITTEKGKTYRSVQLVSSAPDGVVIQYRPTDGGIGMTKLRYRDLPESIRKEFRYDEAAAAEFETARAQALAQWREDLQTRQPEVKQEPEAIAANQMQGALPGEAFPVGRFRAAGTIRGAMILDTITGEAWLVDLHSTLQDYQDRGYFLRPKVTLPYAPSPQAIVIGP